MSQRANLLVTSLLEPETIESLTLESWDILIRQARSAQLLVRLAAQLSGTGLLEKVPEHPRQHLVAVLALHAHQQLAVRREIEHLLDAFEGRGLRLVLLKGAAYAIADLPPGRARLFADIDLLVPKSRLRDAELALMSHGWSSANHDAYDQRYYREWMHELPPLMHLTRMSTIDVHHNLVPSTAPIHPDATRLLDDAVPCLGRPDIFVLSPNDMILHSAVHLFHDGEFENALRDLFDIRDLVNHWMQSERSWISLAERARELELERPLAYALRYLQKLLHTPVPTELSDFKMHTGAGLKWKVLDAIFERGLRPPHPSCNDRLSTFARSILYARGHALRMPLPLLVPHLMRKSLIRWNVKPDSRQAAPAIGDRLPRP
ncbi:MAG TPA: nucleotidyltransferase family protein [Azoarcus taiwanensis]|nr:nucleotidyltransferase family protein [Azoarcus taiwanensis]